MEVHVTPKRLLTLFWFIPLTLNAKRPQEAWFQDYI